MKLKVVTVEEHLVPKGVRKAMKTLEKMGERMMTWELLDSYLIPGRLYTLVGSQAAPVDANGMRAFIDSARKVGVEPHHMGKYLRVIINGKTHRIWMACHDFV